MNKRINFIICVKRFFLMGLFLLVKSLFILMGFWLLKRRNFVHAITVQPAEVIILSKIGIMIANNAKTKIK